MAEETIKYTHPDARFHHDDWGSQRSLFLSPEMFEEFILPAYKKIYGYWKANGVQVIIHHSDSYAAELVPAMIEMGVDVFQGAVSDNNIPWFLLNLILFTSRRNNTEIKEISNRESSIYRYCFQKWKVRKWRIFSFSPGC